MATAITFFGCHVAFFFRQAHGNWSGYNMATAVQPTWQLQLLSHGNYIALHLATAVASTRQLPNFAPTFHLLHPFSYTINLMATNTLYIMMATTTARWQLFFSSSPST
jgi:hypothetical protein